MGLFEKQVDDVRQHIERKIRELDGDNDDLTCNEQLVTPEQAAYWLKYCSRPNRSLSKDTVNAYARDMVNGKWSRNGQPISFDTNGKLINGYHRLSAIVKSSTSVMLLIVRNIQPAAMADIDRGRLRTVSDILGIEGYPHVKMMASRTGMVAMILRGVSFAGVLTRSEIVTIFNTRPGIKWTLEAIPKGTGIGAAPIAAGFAVAWEVNPVETEAAVRAYFVARLKNSSVP